MNYLRTFLLFSLLYFALTGNVLSKMIFDTNAIGFQRGPFYFGADAETFAIIPEGFKRFTDMSTNDGESFKNVLRNLGNPVLRLASMQRWDWRGEKETLNLVTSALYAKFRAQRDNIRGVAPQQKTLGYQYVSAKSYYDFCKANGITTIPMLDIHLFYNTRAARVENISSHLPEAANQYAAGYAKFIKKGGYKTLFWEIGNEEYMPAYNFSPEEYAAVTKSFIDAILKVNPYAKFGIQLYLNDLAPEWKAWSVKVLELLSDYSSHIDYACMHYYVYSYFTDSSLQSSVQILSDYGFRNTKIALTEWRHTATANEDDQQCKTASLFSRFLMFMIRNPSIEVSCVHAFPLFGGLAEWSNGKTWTSFSVSETSKRKRDSLAIARWRILPFGNAQKMIIEATSGATLMGFAENPGKVSGYFFRKQSGGYSLVIINESLKAASEDIEIRSAFPLRLVGEKDLFCPNPGAFPLDSGPQPWKFISRVSQNQNKVPLGSGFSIRNNVLSAVVRPYSVVTLDIM